MGEASALRKRCRLRQIAEREVLASATKEPVLLTEESQPSYVIMSENNYQQLIQRLAQLEDHVFGQLAQAAVKNSQMVGTQTFTVELQRLASLNSNNH